jgi:hypothetical protein
MNHGIRYGLTKNGLIGYCDSDYGGNIDSRRSTSGFLILLNGGPVAWSSCSQSCVALSTTKAEFVAAFKATREGIWLGRLMKDIIPERKGPIDIMCDNKSAIDLIRNPVHHQRSKHIDVRFYFVREQQEAGEIDVQQISTTYQLADPLTRPLANPRFTSLRESIGIVPISTDLISFSFL